MTAAAVETHGLRRRFGSAEPVKGIDLDVAEGEIFGFLGPNGAGKSTTINMLCTLLRPSAGAAKVAGFDVEEEREEVRRNIGLVFQDSVLDGYLTAEQNLRFHCGMFGVPRNVMNERIELVLRTVGLSERRFDTAMNYSGGMKRRLEIARGLLHSPRVLFLDEPTAGLDPQSRRSIWEYVLELRERTGITVFMTTHYLEEAEFCDRIAILDRGRIAALDTPDHLKSGMRSDRVVLTTDEPEAVAARLRGDLAITDVTLTSNTVRFLVPNGASFVPRLFGELEGRIDTVEVSRPSLDDVFLSHTDGESGIG